MIVFLPFRMEIDDHHSSINRFSVIEDDQNRKAADNYKVGEFTTLTKGRKLPWWKLMLMASVDE